MYIGDGWGMISVPIIEAVIVIKNLGDGHTFAAGSAKRRMDSSSGRSKVGVSN